MAPKRINKVSIFTNMNATQANAYLDDLLQSMDSDGVIMCADDIKGIQKIIQELEKLQPKKKK